MILAYYAIIATQQPTLLIAVTYSEKNNVIIFNAFLYLEYAKKLTAAGVHNELFLVKGAIHAFYTLPAIFEELCQAAYSRTVEFIKTWGSDDDASKY